MQHRLLAPLSAAGDAINTAGVFAGRFACSMNQTTDRDYSSVAGTAKASATAR
jgi:hypothetical protein